MPQITTVEKNGQRTYIIDGEPHISVTTALQIIRLKWLEQWRGRVGNEAADAITEEAAGIGKDLHALIALHNFRKAGIIAPDKVYQGEEPLWGRAHTEGTESILEKMLYAYKRWCDTYVEEIYAVELTTWHPLWKYAGTLDLELKIKGDTTITLADIKTSSQLSPIMGLQLAAYKEAEACHGRPTDRRVVIWIPKDDPNWVHTQDYYNPNQDFAAFTHALNLFRYLEEK